MKIERYEHAKHYDQVMGWLRKRDIKEVPQELFAPFGYVIDDCAVGFLVKTDAGVCYIEHMAADPDAEEGRRDKALQLLFVLLENAGRAAGFKMITILTRLSAMKKRVEERGFSEFGDFTLNYKKL